MADPQREFHVAAVIARQPAEAFLRLADPVLDGAVTAFLFHPPARELFDRYVRIAVNRQR